LKSLSKVKAKNYLNWIPIGWSSSGLLLAVIDAGLVEDSFDEKLEQTIIGGHDVVGGGATVAGLAQQAVDQRKDLVEAGNRYCSWNFWML